MIRSGITTRSQPRGDTNGFSQAQRHLGNLSTISRLAGRRRPRLLKVRAARVCQGRSGRAVIQFDVTTSDLTPDDRDKLLKELQRDGTRFRHQ